MSQQDRVGVGWTRVHQKPQVEDVHEQQELPGVERVVEKEIRELVEAVWAQMHVCALGLLVVGGVQVDDSTKLQIVRQELKCLARFVSEIKSTDVTLRPAQGEDPNEDNQVQLS